jgi:hypothetical protein
MGKIVVTEFISLDGIVEDPGGAEAGAPADWTSFGRGAEGDQRTDLRKRITTHAGACRPSPRTEDETAAWPR